MFTTEHCNIIQSPIGKFRSSVGKILRSLVENPYISGRKALRSLVGKPLDLWSESP